MSFGCPPPVCPGVIQRKMDGSMPSIKAELLEFLHQEWHSHPAAM